MESNGTPVSKPLSQFHHESIVNRIFCQEYFSYSGNFFLQELREVSEKANLKCAKIDISTPEGYSEMCKHSTLTLDDAFDAIKGCKPLSLPQFLSSITFDISYDEMEYFKVHGKHEVGNEDVPKDGAMRGDQFIYPIGKHAELAARWRTVLRIAGARVSLARKQIEKIQNEEPNENKEKEGFQHETLFVKDMILTCVTYNSYGNGVSQATQVTSACDVGFEEYKANYHKHGLLSWFAFDDNVLKGSLENVEINFFDKFWTTRQLYKYMNEEKLLKLPTIHVCDEESDGGLENIGIETSRNDLLNMPGPSNVTEQPAPPKQCHGYSGSIPQRKSSLNIRERVSSRALLQSKRALTEREQRDRSNRLSSGGSVIPITKSSLNVRERRSQCMRGHESSGALPQATKALKEGGQGSLWNQRPISNSALHKTNSSLNIREQGSSRALPQSKHALTEREQRDRSNRLSSGGSVIPIKKSSLNVRERRSQYMQGHGSSGALPQATKALKEGGQGSLWNQRPISNLAFPKTKSSLNVREQWSQGAIGTSSKISVTSNERELKFPREHGQRLSGGILKPASRSSAREQGSLQKHVKMDPACIPKNTATSNVSKQESPRKQLQFSTETSPEIKPTSNLTEQKRPCKELQVLAGTISQNVMAQFQTKFSEIQSHFSSPPGSPKKPKPVMIDQSTSTADDAKEASDLAEKANC